MWGGPPKSSPNWWYPIWRFPKMGVAPIVGWFIMENPKIERMITRGTPLGNPHIPLVV